jgi:hypothetical protein
MVIGGIAAAFFLDHPTGDAALKDACSQLLQGHAVNRIVGPSRTITAERVRDWCAKHDRP